MTIEVLLEKMALLLEANGEDGWSSVLRSIREEAKVSLGPAAKRVISLYGGMGSLQDIVLQSEGVSDLDNDRFDRMRTELYVIVQAVIKKDRNSIVD